MRVVRYSSQTALIAYALSESEGFVASLMIPAFSMSFSMASRKVGTTPTAPRPPYVPMVLT
jgi:hypothetical protein